MRHLTRSLTVMGALVAVACSATPSVASSEVLRVDWKRHGYYGHTPRWAPPPPRHYYYAPPPPRYYFPPPVYYAPPPPPRRYYVPPPGVGLYFRF